MITRKCLFRPKEYLKPKAVKEAITLLKENGKRGRVVAGGTDLMVEQDPGIEVLIDITNLGLEYLKNGSEGVKIGAATTFAEIAVCPFLSIAPYNVLAEAARQIGTPQIRNLATIGGNLCSAVPSADSAPALLVLDSMLYATGPNGKRGMNITEFFRDVRKTALEGDELLTEIELPAFSDNAAAVFVKKGRVAAGDLAVVNVAVRLAMEGDRCKDVRIALGAVAPTPLRAKKAEMMLHGQELKDKLVRETAVQASKEISPISDVRSSADYRRALSCVLVERALKALIFLSRKDQKFRRQKG